MTQLIALCTLTSPAMSGGHPKEAEWHWICHQLPFQRTAATLEFSEYHRVVLHGKSTSPGIGFCVDAPLLEMARSIGCKGNRPLTGLEARAHEAGFLS